MEMVVEKQEKKISDRLIDKSRLNETLERFYIPKLFKDYFPSFNRLLNKCPGYMQSIVTVFKENLHGTTTTVSLPYNFTSHAVTSRRFQAIHTAERIRSLKSELEGQPEAQRETLAYKIASKTFQKELTEKREWYADAVINELYHHYQNKEMAESFDEVLRQGCVLLWSGIEIFAREFVRICLNHHKHLVIKFLFAKEVQRHFQLNKAFITAIQSGDSILLRCRFNSLRAFKISLLAMFPQNVKLRETLSSRPLLLLANKRHLIVHKRAIVDKEYLEATNDTGIGVNCKIRILPADFETYVLTSCDLVRHCLRSIIR